MMNEIDTSPVEFFPQTRTDALLRFVFKPPWQLKLPRRRLTIAEAAAYFEVQVASIKRWIDRGLIKPGWGLIEKTDRDGKRVLFIDLRALKRGNDIAAEISLGVLERKLGHFCRACGQYNPPEQQRERRYRAGLVNSEAFRSTRASFPPAAGAMPGRPRQESCIALRSESERASRDNIRAGTGSRARGA